MTSMWESVFFTLAVSAAVLFFIVSLLKEKKEASGTRANKSSSKKKKKSKKKGAKERILLPNSQSKEEEPREKQAESAEANTKPGREGSSGKRDAESKAESRGATPKNPAKSVPIKSVDPSSFVAAVKRLPLQEADVPVDHLDEFVHVDGQKEYSQEDADFWNLLKDKGLSRIKPQTSAQDSQQNDYFPSVQSEDGWEVVKSSKGNRKSSFTSGSGGAGSGGKKGTDESTKKQRESQRKRERERQKKELLRMEAQKNGLHQVWS